MSMENIQQRFLRDLNQIGDRHERDAQGKLPVSFWREVTFYFFKVELKSKWLFWGLPLSFTLVTLFANNPSGVVFWIVVLALVLGYLYFSAKSTAKAIRNNGEKWKDSSSAIEE